ncbi:DUF2306 domain-containing protein [Chryseolinea lacunae]|uniref:DUF2306 domain-containing protein n=1 Tax=Chryseolinea lacunae TaxID=2801331 RepID=A0ABS1KWH8_9BACT|nr:DUF2306 domain-containing protein [Chryseolinea lacunae]MBL0743548.1 DUF2306 domain-containing protein [Chryseolinea lacunae]
MAYSSPGEPTSNASRQSLLRMLLLFTAWLAIIALSLWFYYTNVLVYLRGFRSRIFGDSLFHNQAWVVMHLVGGTFALLLGPMQFWPWLRNRFLSLHRLAGKLYMAGVLLIGLSALRLSLLSFCEPCRVSLFILAVLVLISTAFAWKAIKAHNLKAHRQFMTRSYICVLSFVAVRIDDILSLDFFFGTLEDPMFRRTVNEYFFSFVPLLVGEIVMTWWPAAMSTFKLKGK